MTASGLTDRGLFLAGKWVHTPETVTVRSPYDGRPLGSAAAARAADVLAAVDAAQTAMATPLPAHERAAVLDRTSAALTARPGAFAQTLAPDAALPTGLLSAAAAPAAPIGDALVGDPRVKALSLSGSRAVGWRLRERAPRKKVFLELGNATPAIVLADAGLPDAAERLASNAFSFAGQSCISVQRVYVESAVADEFLSYFLKRVDQLVVGDPASESTDVGPVISSSNRERILRWINTSGGTIAAGGTVTGDGIIRPTVIIEPQRDADVCRREIFGPVCIVSWVADLDDAIAQANDSDYGLQAGVFTTDINRALDAAARRGYGGVLVNEAPTFRRAPMRYGGRHGA